MSHTAHDGPSQRDGTFSDALVDDQHPLHPRVGFDHGDEFDEEALHRAAQELVCVLAGRELNSARFPLSEVVSKAQKMKSEVDRALVKLGAASEADPARLVRAYERALRWIWGDGKLEPYPVLLQLAAFTWTFFPTITRASSQVELLRYLGLRDKQQFNRFVAACRDEFGYMNPLMRDGEAVEHFRAAARERSMAHAK